MTLSVRMQRFVKRMHARTYVTYRDYERQDVAARIIQKRWRMAIANPTYIICVRRLQNELESMNRTFIT